MSQALLIRDCNTLSTLNYVIKGCVHRLMQRPGLSFHFEKKKQIQRIGQTVPHRRPKQTKILKM
jgi:hypothetical protein